MNKEKSIHLKSKLTLKLKFTAIYEFFMKIQNLDKNQRDRSFLFVTIIKMFTIYLVRQICQEKIQQSRPNR